MYSWGAKWNKLYEIKQYRIVLTFWSSKLHPEQTYLWQTWPPWTPGGVPQWKTEVTLTCPHRSQRCCLLARRTRCHLSYIHLCSHEGKEEEDAEKRKKKKLLKQQPRKDFMNLWLKAKCSEKKFLSPAPWPWTKTAV